MTRITLVTDGIDWDRWSSMELRQSIDMLAPVLSATASDPRREGVVRFNVRGGSEMALLLDGDELFRGFVTRYRNEKGAANGVSITAAATVQSLVGGGHEGPYFWQNVAGAQIVSDVLSPYGFDWRTDAPLLSIGEEGYRVGVNESPHQILRRLAERSGLLLWNDAGTLRFGDGMRDDPVQPLGECAHSRAAIEADFAGRFSKIIVKWQAPNVTRVDDTALQEGQTVWEDPAAPRYMPLVLVETGEEDARERLTELLAARAVGEAQIMRVTVHSPRRPDGLFWRPGQLVAVEDSVLGIDDTLIAHEVVHGVTNGGGWQTQISLRARQAQSGALSARETRRTGEFFAPATAPLDVVTAP